MSVRDQETQDRAFTFPDVCSGTVKFLWGLDLRGMGYANLSGCLVMSVFLMCLLPTPWAPDKHTHTVSQ